MTAVTVNFFHKALIYFLKAFHNHRCKGQIPEQIKAKRSARLIELGEKNRRAYEESFLGKTVEVLVEEKSDVNGKEMWTGHTKEYMKIALESEKNLQNCILNVQIKDGREIIH